MLWGDGGREAFLAFSKRILVVSVEYKVWSIRRALRKKAASDRSYFRTTLQSSVSLWSLLGFLRNFLLHKKAPKNISRRS